MAFTNAALEAFINDLKANGDHAAFTSGLNNFANVLSGGVNLGNVPQLLAIKSELGNVLAKYETGPHQNIVADINAEGEQLSTKVKANILNTGVDYSTEAGKMRQLANGKIEEAPTVGGTATDPNQAANAAAEAAKKEEDRKKEEAAKNNSLENIFSSGNFLQIAIKLFCLALGIGRQEETPKTTPASDAAKPNTPVPTATATEQKTESANDLPPEQKERAAAAAAGLNGVAPGAENRTGRITVGSQRSVVTEKQ